MTKSALTYAWIIIALGTAVLACAFVAWHSPDGGAWLECLGLAALAATFKVKLPKLTGTISPAFVFLLVSVATQSWSETVVIAALSGIVQCLWRPKIRPTLLQVAFNAATMAIAGGMAHAVGRELTRAGDADALVVVLGAAGVALLVSNTWIVSTILCLLEEAPFYKVWRSIQLWAVPYYLAGGLLASVWSRAELTAGVSVTILAAASVYLLNTCARELGLMIVDKQGVCA